MSGGTGTVQEHAPPCRVPVVEVTSGAGPAFSSDASDLGVVAGAVPHARRVAREAVAQWDVPAERGDVVELIVSELITNALQACIRLPASDILSIRLRLADRGPRVLIEVIDPAPVSPAIQQPADDELHGRGLLLVASLSEDWGWYPMSSKRKVVWAKVAKCPA
jgi:anti-sigma regulatory factor (Ser/Thr protein kinase)